MKIIHVVLGKANPQRMNGVNKVVYSLASTQTQQGEDVEVWGITPQIDSGIGYEAPYKVRLFKASKDPYKIDEALRLALDDLHTEAVFHLHGAFIPQFYTLSGIFKRKLLPFFLTPHGAYHPVALSGSGLRKRIYYWLFERKVIKRSAQLHLLGEKECGYPVFLAPSGQKIIIPNGQEIAADVKPLTLASSEVPIFGFMGRMDIRHKGLDLLLDGFNIYKDKYEGTAKLWMIGDGDDKKSLELKAKNLSAAEDIKFWGPLYGEEKENVLAQLHVFMHTSRYEGVPMGVLECALLGIPSIISEETNIRTFVEAYNSGLVLDELSPLDIAQKMKQMQGLVAAEDYHTLRENAFHMVKNEFDWHRIALRFKEYYLASLKA